MQRVSHFVWPVHVVQLDTRVSSVQQTLWAVMKSTMTADKHEEDKTFVRIRHMVLVCHCLPF